MNGIGQVSEQSLSLADRKERFAHAEGRALNETRPLADPVGEGKTIVIINGRTHTMKRHDPKILAKKLQERIDRRKAEAAHRGFRSRRERLEDAEAAMARAKR